MTRGGRCSPGPRCLPGQDVGRRSTVRQLMGDGNASGRIDRQIFHRPRASRRMLCRLIGELPKQAPLNDYREGMSSILGVGIYCRHHALSFMRWNNDLSLGSGDSHYTILWLVHNTIDKQALVSARNEPSSFVIGAAVAPHKAATQAVGPLRANSGLKRTIDMAPSAPRAGAKYGMSGPPAQ